MLKRLLSVVLAASLTFGPSTLPARADCCDDFWSCVATVATLGLSCKAQQIAAAIEGMKKLIAAVEATRKGFSKTSDDTAYKMKDDVRSAGDAMKEDVRKSVEDIKKAMTDTEVLSNKQSMILAPATGVGSAGAGALAMSPGAAAAPAGKSSSSQLGGASALAPGGTAGGTILYTKPADPARVAADLKRAFEWVQATHKNADTKKAPVVSSHTGEAKKLVNAHEMSARKIVGVQLLSPLDLVKGELENILAKILNPFDFSSVTKSIDARIKLIQSQAPNTFDSMAKEMSSEAVGRLDEGQRMADDVKKEAEESRKIADQAEKLAKSKTQGDLEKLELLIGKPPSSMAMVQPSIGGGMARAPASSSIASLALLKSQGTMKASRARAQTLATGLGTQWASTRNLLNLSPVAVTPAMEKKVAGDLSKMFSGKSSADAKKAQQQLLDQARARFAKDPKTLAAVEKYLQQKTTSLVPAAVAPIRR